MDSLCRDSGIQQHRIRSGLELAKIAPAHPQLPTRSGQKKRLCLQTFLQLIGSDFCQWRLTGFISDTERGHSLRSGWHKQFKTAKKTGVVHLTIHGVFTHQSQLPGIIHLKCLNASLVGGEIVAQQVIAPRADHGSLYAASCMWHVRDSDAGKRIQPDCVNQCLIARDHKLLRIA